MTAPEAHRAAHPAATHPAATHHPSATRPFAMPGAAAALAELAPLDRPATICLTLDDQRRPLGSYVIDHADPGDDPDAVLGVAEDLAEIVVTAHEVGAVVLASIRPNTACGPADSSRLLELTMLFDGVGVELLDWLVVHPSGVVNVRAATGEPSRW